MCHNLLTYGAPTYLWICIYYYKMMFKEESIVWWLRENKISGTTGCLGEKKANGWGSYAERRGKTADL